MPSWTSRPERVVKVTDFGIARAADGVGITRTGAVMGTPQYLSPEQAEGKPATPASDVYALGVVAFECLAGRRPFEAETPVATVLAHLQQVPLPHGSAGVVVGWTDWQDVVEAPVPEEGRVERPDGVGGADEEATLAPPERHQHLQQLVDHCH